MTAAPWQSGVNPSRPCATKPRLIPRTPSVGRGHGNRHPYAADRSARRAVPAADGAAGPAELVRPPGAGLVAGDPRRGLALPRLGAGAVLDHALHGPDGAGDRLPLR